jgi:hypothetical protein
LTTAEEEQLVLQGALLGLSEWLKRIAAYDQWDRATSPFDSHNLITDIQKVLILRNRAASSLLKVAFTGEMSSGKSFLISALHQQLKYSLVLDDKNRPAEKYSGLLPSFTEPTSACPVTVQPVSAEDGTIPPVTLNIKFADSLEWEWIADNPDPRVVTAYLTDIEARVRERRDDHRGRVVAEAQLLVPAVDMPAILYDLPGLNAPEKRHDMTARKGWHEADCFVYVTPATHTLMDTELELVTELYNHYKTSSGRKKVLWVVTAIDTAMDITDDQLPRWRSTVRRNTEYLREFIASTGSADPDFVGPGFIGVSPALEARSQFRRETDITLSEEDKSDSRMDEFRRSLGGVIQDGAGLRHLAIVAAEAQVCLGRYERPLQDILGATRLTYDQVRVEISELERSIAHLGPLADQLRRDFGERLRTDIERIVSPFGTRHGFGRFLHDELDDYINSANLMSPRAIAALELRKTRLMREWIGRKGGPREVWEQELLKLDGELDLRIREALSYSYTGSKVADSQKLDLESFKISSRGARTLAQQDDLAVKATSIMGTVFGVAGAAVTGVATTGLAGSAATVAGVTITTALGLALAPVGIGMAAAGVYAWSRHRRQRKSSLDMMRREEIDALEQDALEAAKWFTVTTLAIGDDLVEHAAERIAVHVAELRAMVLRRRDTLNAPEGRQRKEHIEVLSQMREQGASLSAILGRHIALLDVSR